MLRKTQATRAALPEDDARRRITVADLLTMRSGLACNDWSPESPGHEDKMYDTDDWAGFMLRQPIAHGVGTQFSYCTGGVILLGHLIERLSGQSVPVFANDRLFGPLVIEGAQWAEAPQGHTDTGGHLRLRVADLHKIARLMLNAGKWQDKQIVSSEWWTELTREHTNIPGRKEKYGYLWWHNSAQVNGKTLNLIYAQGNGGNFIFVVPELQLAAAFTGINFNKAEQFIPLQLLARDIVPALLERPGQVAKN